MSSDDPLDWSSLRLRLERTRSPRWAWTVAPPVTGPQLYLAEREMLASSAKGSPKLEIEVANLGTERATPKAQVLDSAGKQVGKSLAATPSSLPPGARKICRFNLTSGQQEVLIEGGSLLLHPGSLPEAYRTFCIRPHPLMPPATLDWPVPVPYFLRFSLGGGQTALGLRVEVESLQREPLAQAFLDLVPGAGKAVSLLLPCTPIRYRFGVGSGFFRDPENPFWLSPPDDTWSLHAPVQEWMLSNSSSLQLIGFLETSPAGRVRVHPEFVDLKPGERRSIKFTLDRSWPEACPKRPESIAVIFRSKESPVGFGGSTERIQFLKLVLRPEPPNGPAVRLVGSPPEPYQAQRIGGRWILVLPLENPGTEPARLTLRLGSGDKESCSVEVPPSLSTRSHLDEGVTFELPDLLTVKMGDDRLLSAWLSSEPSIIWDPRLRDHRFKIEFTEGPGTRIPPEQISKAGDLAWQVEGTMAKLLFRNESLPIMVQQVNLFRNGFPKDSMYPMKTIGPGEKNDPLAVEPIKLHWLQRKLRLRAEVFAVSGAFGFKRVAELTCRRKGGGIEVEEQHFE
ncbi:MAG TPA: hypothetical protein VIA62_15335 [Thermoanaerobaculia bacterium]|jgi:hypothetical protein|nr:hypothetical protein [Thermoanaerobaculia bacterium]